MAYLQTSSEQRRKLLPLTLSVVLILSVVMVAAFFVISNNSDVRSRASRNNFLTPGDDGLSLQQDLRNLEMDQTVTDDKSLDAIQ